MRSYDQNCGVARSLDLLGERWTLLIVRELFLGPRRYRDLLGAMPAMGTNLLAARLKVMTQEDIVEPGPGGEGYRLTAHGEELRPILEALALWGFRRIRLDDPKATTRISWAALSMCANFDAAHAPAGDLVAELEVDDERVWLGVLDGAPRAGTDEPPRPADVRARCDRPTFYGLAIGRRDPALVAAVQLDGGGLGDLIGVLDALVLPDVDIGAEQA